MTLIRVMLVDDHDLVRQGIRELVERQADMVVAGESASAAATMESLSETVPDVIMLDISLPDMNGLELLGRISQNYPDMKVVVHSMHENRAYLVSAIEKGAYGYVVKGAESFHLLSAIRSASMNKHYLCEKVRRHAPEGFIEALEIIYG